MDPRPFRCAYDPELAKAAGGVQQGPKPVFVKARGTVTVDPRRREPATRGKRAVPKQLPPAGFARRRAREPREALEPLEPRVHLSNLGPLVTRVQVSDAAAFFGAVRSCDMVVARTTNASLGVASVVFGGAPADAQRAAEQIVAACARGALTIGGVRGVRAAVDARRALWRDAQAAANAEPAAAPPAPRRATDAADSSQGGLPLSPSPDDMSVHVVDLRTLSTPQLDEWYRRYIGPSPTYVLVPQHNVSPMSCPVRDMAARFQGYAFTRIAVNRTGFFVVFDSIDEAERCFNALDGQYFMSTRLKLALTLGGERIPGAELRALRRRRRRQTDAGAAGGFAREGDLLPRAARLSPEEFAEAGKTGVDALLSDMKRQAWNLFVRRTVITAVNKAVEQRRQVLRTEAERAVAPVTPESESSEPETAYKSAFGIRRAMRDTGKASRHLSLPTVRMRKRTAEPADVKPRKVLKRETVAPKTYIRGLRPRELKRSHMSDDEDEDDDAADDDDEYDDNEIDNEKNDNEDENGDRNGGNMERDSASISTDEDETKVEMDGVVYGRSKGRRATPASMVHDLDIKEEPETEAEAEDERPFQLPPSPPPEPHHALGFAELKRLVRTSEDFVSLQSVLHSAQLPPVSEDEVRARFGRRKPFRLDSAPPNWPEQATPFREAPFRVRSDDERRSYLPVADSGMPNEIVQNYRYRPLYEDEEDEDDSSKLELRKDARVLSRSSFGVGSDLFADDTLSKNVKDVRLARSSIHDWGLYANEQIPEGEFVIEYVGDVLRDEYADVRERNYMMEGIDSSYLFRLDNGTVIDATKRGNGARFINHSCDPNCIAQVFDHDGFKRVVLFSVRDIQPDEELTFDYNFVRAQDDEGKVRCACGAANCRGWLI